MRNRLIIRNPNFPVRSTRLLVQLNSHASNQKQRLLDRNHQWSTRPAHCPGWHWFFVYFEVLWRTDGRTTCVKIVITTGRDCGSASWIKFWISSNYSSSRRRPAGGRSDRTISWAIWLTRMYQTRSWLFTVNRRP